MWLAFSFTKYSVVVSVDASFERSFWKWETPPVLYPIGRKSVDVCGSLGVGMMTEKCLY